MYRRSLDLLLLVATLLCGLRALRGQGTECSVGEVRLAGGTNPLEGRVEVCLPGGSGPSPVWGVVCNVEWGRADAEVVCRQLGVQNFSQIVPSVYFTVSYPNPLPFHWRETHCNGNETHLVNCSRTSEGACQATQEIGLICSVPVPECENGSVRIVDALGNSSIVGRVEYCVEGRWGSICDTISQWNDEDAQVVCRQLGLSGASTEPRALESALIPQAANTVPIALDVVQCGGSEETLSMCTSEPHVEGCSHGNDVGVNCSSNIECSEEGGVRLVGGDGVSEGRVEYCRDDLRWGSVCRRGWDHDDAQVVCRQLGFTGVSVSERDTFPPDPDHTFRHIGPLSCTGNETNLLECPESGTCLTGTGAGVKCYNESSCEPTLGLRLRDGVLSGEMGTVELCYGDWGFLCADSWDDSDAEVVCRQLGLTGGVAISPSPFGTDLGRFLLDDIACSGEESVVTECGHPGIGSHNCKTRSEQQAAVICGVTRGAPLLQCTAEQLAQSLSTNETSLSVAGYGVCEEFKGQSNICGSVFTEMPGFVYRNSTVPDQNELLYSLDQVLSDSILEDNSECKAMIQSVVCHHFLPSCGAEGGVFLPRGVCSEECSRVSDSCGEEWARISALLGLSELLSVIDCTDTQSYITPLPGCCTIVTMPGVPSTASTSTAAPPLPPTSQTVAMVTAIVISLLALLLIGVVIAALVIGCVISTRKRKAAFRRFQMSVLSGASTRSSFQRTSSTFLAAEDPSVMLRNGSISRGPLAVPNPYANKRELEFESSTLLSPQDSSIKNRISSSIIRELTSNLLIPYNRLKLLDCVGHGEFGVVYKAHYAEPEGDIGYNTSIVAVKTLKGMYDQDQVNKIMEESIKMKNFAHPNVLSLIGVCLDAGSVPYVVMPYMANGSLLHYLKKERRNLVLPVDSDEDVRFEVCKRLVVMCMQISCGMEYLAHERFVHRDLAARNCMIDIHFVIKIADFGLSEDMYAKNYFRQSATDKSVKLPVKWMAPESLSDALFSEKSDVWSFGVTCWEVFSGGKTPYPGVDPMTLSKMLDGGKRLSKPLNSACPEEIYQVMLQCWAKSPEQRPAFGDLVETISEYAEKIAGYLDVSSYNPFTATYEEIKPVEDSTTVSSPEQVLQHMKNKEIQLKSTPCNSTRNSPKPSPRGSPWNSPRGTPRQTHSPWQTPSPQRRLSVGTGAGHGIQITITKSPSFS